MKRERERERERGFSTPSSKQQQSLKNTHKNKETTNKEQTNKETNKQKETKRKQESNASTVLPILFASKRKLKNKKQKQQPATNPPTKQPSNKNEQQQQTPSTADKFCYWGCLIPLKLSGPIQIVCPCTVDKLCMQKWTTPKGAFLIHWTNTTIFITIKIEKKLIRYKNPSHLYKL